MSLRESNLKPPTSNQRAALLHPMSSVTAHVSEYENDTPRPSFQTMDALRKHFQKYVHLHESR